MESVDLPDDRRQVFIRHHAHVVEVTDLFSNEYLREGDEGLDAFVGEDGKLHLLTGVDLSTVAFTKFGEEPHVLILFVEEVVKIF